jgi:hypothetical protein
MYRIIMIIADFPGHIGDLPDNVRHKQAALPECPPLMHVVYAV